MIKKKVAILSNFPVWLVNDTVPAIPGHYPVWLLPLYSAFSTHSCPYEIHWLILHKGIKNNIYFEQNQQHFHVIKATKISIGLFSAYIYDRARLTKELNRINPDLIHTWGTEYCYGLAGCDYQKTTWLHSVQGILKSCMEMGPTNWFIRLHSMYEPGVIKKAPHITTESPWAAEQIKKLCSHAEPILWDYAVEDRFFQAKRKLSSSPCYLYCGASSPLKNVQTIISAFSHKELAHVQLVLAGPDRREYENLPPNIHPVGRVSRDEVVRLMSESWGLIHSSLVDTGPTVAKEARVMGLPVIISTHCGSQQYVDHGKSGFVISPRDVDALVQGVLQLSASTAQNLSMGAHGQEKCREALSSETMCSGLLKIYHNLLGN